VRCSSLVDWPVYPRLSARAIPADTALPAAFIAFGQEGSGRVGLGRLVPILRRWTRGPPGRL
jgi:hypothetical protein